MNRDDLPTTSSTKLVEVLNDPPKCRKLKLELAITLDSMEPFVRATYNLEGDGMLAMFAYQQISKLKSAVISEHYPNVNALAKHESGGNASHERQLLENAKCCVRPAHEYFKAKFDDGSGKLKTALLAFKAARYFLPTLLNELKPAASDMDSLNVFPFINADLLGKLKGELPTYLAATEDISPDINIMNWWKRHEKEMPAWSQTCKLVVLVQPSSAAAERVFSLLQNSFTKRQQSLLEDYVSLLIMIRNTNCPLFCMTLKNLLSLIIINFWNIYHHY